LTVKEHE